MVDVSKRIEPGDWIPYWPAPVPRTWDQLLPYLDSEFRKIAQMKANKASSTVPGIGETIVLDDPSYAPSENGFVDREGESTLAFDDGTREFSLTPTGVSFDYFHGSTKFTQVGKDTVVITDVEGPHYIYYSGPTLSSTTTFIEDLILVYALAGAIYWDASNNKAIRVGDERHGNIMDAATHSYNHSTLHTRFESGLALGNMDTDGTGNSAAHAQFSVGNGYIRDEDIRHSIQNGSPQTLSLIAEIPVFYREGAAAWRKFDATLYPVATVGTGRAAVNLYSIPLETWSAGEVTSGKYVVYQYLATGDIYEPVIAIMGQVEYSTLSAARQGADDELNSLALGVLATLMPEFLPIASVIWQTKNSYSNAVQSRIRTTEDGHDYIDRRYTTGGTGSGSASTFDPFAFHSNTSTEYSALGAKNPVVADDIISGEDSAGGFDKIKITLTTLASFMSSKLAAVFLKLDGSNSPMTGALSIERAGVSGTQVKGLSGGLTNYSAFSVGRLAEEAWMGVAGEVGQYSKEAAAGDAVFRSAPGSAILSAFSATGDVIFTTGNPDSAKMVIANSGDVGIGTGVAAPAANLEVFSGDSSPVTLCKTDASFTPEFVLDSDRTAAAQWLGIFKGKWAGTTVAQMTIVAGPDAVNKDDGVIIFNTAIGGSLSPRMLIGHDGKVGIGTGAVAADEMLHVESGGTPADARIKIENSFVLPNTAGLSLVNTFGGGTHWGIDNKGATGGLTIADYAGFTGLALPAPGDPAYMYGRTGTTTGSTALLLGNHNGTGYDDHISILDNGRVGVGLTTPQRNLHVHSAAGADSRIQITNSTSGSGQYDGMWLGITSAAYLWVNENTKFHIGTFGSTRVTVTASGDFGIGTTSPAEKLDVAGSMLASGDISAEGHLALGTAAILAPSPINHSEDYAGDITSYFRNTNTTTRGVGVTLSNIISAVANAWLIRNDTAGNFQITLSGSGVAEFQIDSDGATTIYMRTNGSAGTKVLRVRNYNGSATDDLLEVYDDGTVAIPNIPTSAAGRPTGTLWKDTADSNRVKAV